VHFAIIKTDNDSRIKKNFRLKVEPEVVMCLYGRNFDRHIGANKDCLFRKIEELLKFKEDGEIPKEIRVYERYCEDAWDHYRQNCLPYKEAGFN